MPQAMRPPASPNRLRQVVIGVLVDDHRRAVRVQQRRHVAGGNADQVADRIGVSWSVAGAAMEAVFDTVREALARGEEVRIGSVGYLASGARSKKRPLAKLFSTRRPAVTIRASRQDDDTTLPASCPGGGAGSSSGGAVGAAPTTSRGRASSRRCGAWLPPTGGRSAAWWRTLLSPAKLRHRSCGARWGTCAFGGNGITTKRRGAAAPCW